MAKTSAMWASSVEFPPQNAPAGELTGGLARLLGVLRSTCPEARAIQFEYDGTLRVHIDVRSRSDVATIQMVLPTLCGGRLFYGLTYGATPHHPFHHRISALVDQ